MHYEYVLHVVMTIFPLETVDTYIHADVHTPKVKASQRITCGTVTQAHSAPVLPGSSQPAGWTRVDFPLHLL